MNLQSNRPVQRFPDVAPSSSRAGSGGAIARVVATLAMVLLVALVLAGCGDGETTAAPAADQPAAPSDGYDLSVTDDDAAPAAADDDTSAAAADTTPADTDADGPERTVSTDGGVPPAEFPTGIAPVHIEIPAIDVDAPVIDLDLRGDEPEVPENFADTGWYQQTRLPGEIGPSVIAGHVDSVNGPAVFARLSLLEPGDEITVTAADGEERSFTVVETGQYPKTSLPDEVFGFGEPIPELRLITCGGTFDRTVRHYVDNFVVYAVSNNQSPSAL